MLEPIQDAFGWRDRINEPAKVYDNNWTFRLPWPCDRLDGVADGDGDVTRFARQWLRRAYDDGHHPRAYPVGIQRLRLTMEVVVERLGSRRGLLVDLGCGGGELGAAAAVRHRQKGRKAKR